MNRVFCHGLQYSYFGGKDRLFGGRQYNAPPDVLYSLLRNRVTKSRYEYQKGSLLGHPLGYRGAGSIPARDSVEHYTLNQEILSLG